MSTTPVSPSWLLAAQLTVSLILAVSPNPMAMVIRATQ
jgi:hypothetical protein